MNCPVFPDAQQPVLSENMLVARLRVEADLRELISVASADGLSDRTALDAAGVVLHALDMGTDVVLAARSLQLLMWERLHSIHWKDVQLVHRELFGLACALIVIDNEHGSCSQGATMLASLRLADFGILMGGSLSACHLIALAEVLHCRLTTDCVVSYKALPPATSVHLPPTPHAPRMMVPYANDAGVQDFFERSFIPQRPVVLRGAAQTWPAISKWRELDYLLRTMGKRTVPIEIGNSYLCAGHSSVLMTIEEYFQRHVAGRGGAIGYMAQHALFDQVPSLLRDLAIPDHTSCECDGEENDGSVVCNAWLGPLGTMSPLHHDCFHNLLAQVVGFKYVRLYAPWFHWELLPLTGKMSNNSSLDLFDDSAASKLASIPFMDIVLAPGDILYLPRHWWHFVLSIDSATAQQFFDSHNDHRGCLPDDSFSFSVNFWWGPRKEKATIV